VRTTSCTNCYRDYPDGYDTCAECGHPCIDLDAKPAKPDVETGAKIIDLFEALKQSLQPKGGAK
jgi:hypothetical protein